jgi:hypothetical protein
MNERIGEEVLDFVSSTMEIEPEWSIRRPGELTWWAGDLQQRIVARVSPDPNPEDGEFVQILIETDVVRQNPISDELAEYAISLNRVATYSGLAPRDGDHSVLALSATVAAWPDTVQKRKKLVLFIATVQLAEAYGIAAEIEEQMGVPRASSVHPTSGARARAEKKIDELWRLSWDPPDPTELNGPTGELPSRFAGPQMEECVAELEGSRCVLCTGDESEMAAEFPFGGKTSIIELQTKAIHERRLVTGLLILERYPVGISDGISPQKCLALAAMERDARLPCAGIGGWTISKDGVLAHAAFLPNSAVRLSHPFDWLSAAAKRAQWLTEVVLGLSWNEYFDESLRNKRETLERLK